MKDVNEEIRKSVIAYSGNGNHILGAKMLQKFGEYVGQDMVFQHVNFSEFSDGEPDNTPNNYEQIDGKMVIFYQSVYNLALAEEALDLIWSFKKQFGAKYVMAVFPFLIFRRQDHPEKMGEVNRLRMMIDRLAHAGVDEMIVVTPHSKQMALNCQEFNVKFTEVDMSKVFAEVLRTYLPAEDSDQVVVHAPDEGSVWRAIQLAKAHGCPVYFNLKNRGLNNDVVIVESDKEEILEVTERLKIEHSFDNLHYAYADSVQDKIVVMIDDEVSTGDTANKNARQLKKNGAKQVFFVSTHPVLTPGWRRRLFYDNPFDRVIMSTTIPRDYSKRTGGSIFDISASAQMGSALYQRVAAYFREK